MRKAQNVFYSTVCWVQSLPTGIKALSLLAILVMAGCKSNSWV